MFFAKSNIRISWSLSAGEHLITDDRLLHQKISRLLYDLLTRHLYPPPLQIPYHYYILIDNCIHLPFLHSIPLILLLQDALNCSPLFRESFELTALQILVTWIPLWIILALIGYPLIPQLFMCYTKVFEIPFDLPTILSSLLLLKFLLACIMVNPISLVILLASLVIIILSLLTQYVCEYTESSLILINYLSGWAAILLTGIGSRPIQLSLIVP